jgi:hypothetical protein
MSDVKRSIAILLSAAALLLMGNGLLVTLLPLRAGIEGFSTTEIGIMGTAFFAGFALGCLIGPRILIRVGHIRAFAGFAALCAVSILIFDLWSQPWGWMVLRGLNGLFFAILFMVIESWLNEQASSEMRGQPSSPPCRWYRCRWPTRQARSRWRPPSSASSASTASHPPGSSGASSSAWWKGPSGRWGRSSPKIGP